MIHDKVFALYGHSSKPTVPTLMLWGDIRMGPFPDMEQSSIGNVSPNIVLGRGALLFRLFLGSFLLGVALLPATAEAQVLDTTKAASDSTDYSIETYFVKTDTRSFFKPHEDEEAVRHLLELSSRGRCRTVTLVRAARQRNAVAVGHRHDGEAINVRLILRCGQPKKAQDIPSLSSPAERL